MFCFALNCPLKVFVKYLENSVYVDIYYSIPMAISIIINTPRVYSLGFFHEAGTGWALINFFYLQGGRLCEAKTELI